MDLRQTAQICALLVALGPAAARVGRAQSSAPTAWIEDTQGRRFRVRFDPGQQLFAGGGAMIAPDAGFAVDVGLRLRAPAPALDAPFFWKRDHELGHFRVGYNSDGARLDARLYRGILLRHSREGSMTIPTSPPLRLALPFDVGLRVEVGRLAGPLTLRPGGPALAAEVVRGEAIADLLRSEHPGRWLTVGVVGYYGVQLARALDGGVGREHVVAPMTAVALSGHGESDAGLVSAGARIEGARAWSSRNAWHSELRAEGELAVTPVAVNDLPLSVVLRADAELSPATLSVFVGLRLGAPLPHDL
jgi:hypothetical protein